MKRILKTLKKKWRLLMCVAIVIIFQCYIQLCIPTLTVAIQSIVSKGANATSIDLATLELGVFPLLKMILEGTEFNYYSWIFIVGGWMLIYSFIVLVLAIFQNYFGAYLGAFVGKMLRKEMFYKVNTLTLSDYDKFGTATLITRTTNDIEQIKNFLTMGIRIMFMSPAYMIIAVIFTINKDYRYLLVFLVIIPLIIIIMAILLILTSPLFKKLQKNLDDITVVLRENLTGIRVVRAYNQQTTEDKKFDEANKNTTKTYLKASQIMTVADPFISVIFNLAYIGIFALGFFFLNGANILDSTVQMQVANINAVSQYAMQMMMSFLMFAMMFIMLPQASASIKRVNEVLNTKNNILDVDNEKFDYDEFSNLETKGTIEFKEVSFTYPDATYPCIEGITFKTKPGTTTAIIGSTGSGKSSIINLIPRFYDATTGEIFLDGVNIRSIPKTLLRDKVGFVPQQAVLFKGTIKENICFGKKDATDEEIQEALNVAQTGHFISKLPDGINTYVAQGGKNFSGGQKQRLAIARALVRKPEIYIFDDSFSALDFKTDAKLRADLKPYTKGASIIIVAQRVSSILDADNIIVVNEGKCVGQGTHTELLKSCPIYQDIVKSQLDKEEVEKTIRLIKEAKEGGY